MGKVLTQKQECTCPQHTQCSLRSYLRRFWGCYLGIHSSPKETKGLLDIPGTSSRLLTKHGPASNMHQTLGGSTLVESGAAAQAFSSLHRRTKHIGKCLRRVLGSYRAWTCFPFLSAISHRVSINRMAAVKKSSNQS